MDEIALDAIGRWLIVISFLIAGVYNLLGARMHTERLRAFGLPFPPLAFAIAMTLQFAGIVLLATGWYDEIGAACLIAFTVIATLIYHRFWTKTDPAERIAARHGMVGNTAIIGGLLLLLQNAL